MKDDNQDETGVERASPDAEALGEIVRGAIEPWAEAEKTKATEATKRYQILSGIAKPVVYGAIAVVFSVIALAFVAFLKGHVETAEKIVFAIISFVGGYGAGRSTKR